MRSATLQSETFPTLLSTIQPGYRMVLLLKGLPLLKAKRRGPTMAARLRRREM